MSYLAFDRISNGSVLQHGPEAYGHWRPGMWVFRIKIIIKDILTKSPTKALQFKLGLIVSETYM